MLKLSREEYEPQYLEILGKLEPAKVVTDLLLLVEPADPVMLCWEVNHDPGAWCHRHMVARWLKDTIGLDVPEWKPTVEQLSLFMT